MYYFTYFLLPVCLPVTNSPAVSDLVFPICQLLSPDPNTHLCTCFSFPNQSLNTYTSPFPPTPDQTICCEVLAAVFKPFYVFWVLPFWTFACMFFKFSSVQLSPASQSKPWWAKQLQPQPWVTCRDISVRVLARPHSSCTAGGADPSRFTAGGDWATAGVQSMVV